MCYRRGFSYFGLAFLCIVSTPVEAISGSIGYEALDGAQCQVSTHTPSQLSAQSGYTEDLGANISFGVTIPFSDPTSEARRNCVEFAEQDQRRQHFTWLLDMYDRGIITRQALEDEAEELGMTLSPDPTKTEQTTLIIR